MTSRDRGSGTLAGAIVAVRQKVGSQQKLATKVGVSERTVKRWEHGAVPQVQFRGKLTELGVDASLFASVEAREEIATRLRLLEAEIARLWRLLEQP